MPTPRRAEAEGTHCETAHCKPRRSYCAPESSLPTQAHRPRQTPGHGHPWESQISVALTERKPNPANQQLHKPQPMIEELLECLLKIIKGVTKSHVSAEQTFDVCRDSTKWKLKPDSIPESVRRERESPGYSNGRLSDSQAYLPCF